MESQSHSSLKRQPFFFPFRFFLKLLRACLPVRESYLLGFVSCLVMKAWARQSILFFLFCAYTCASDISCPGSEDYSQENHVAFLQLPAEAALRLPGHISE